MITGFFHLLPMPAQAGVAGEMGRCPWVSSCPVGEGPAPPERRRCTRCGWRRGSLRGRDGRIPAACMGWPGWVRGSPQRPRPAGPGSEETPDGESSARPLQDLCRYLCLLRFERASRKGRRPLRECRVGQSRQRNAQRHGLFCGSLEPPQHLLGHPDAKLCGPARRGAHAAEEDHPSPVAADARASPKRSWHSTGLRAGSQPWQCLQREQAACVPALSLTTACTTDSMKSC